MATNYPESLDVLQNPDPNDRLNSTQVPHHQQHADANDAIEAIQAVLGANPAGSYLTIKDRVIAAEENIVDKSTLNGMNDVTITSVTSGDVLRFDGSSWQNYHETNIVNGGNF